MATRFIVEFKGVKRLIKDVEKLSLRASEEIKDAVSEAALGIQGTARRSMAQGGRGIVYRRRGIEHKASAPGDPPATDTGRLSSSINITTGFRGGLTAEIGTNVFYAPQLEFGTTRIAPRPFLFPALERERPKFEKAVSDILKREIAK